MACRVSRSFSRAASRAITPSPFDLGFFIAWCAAQACKEILRARLVVQRTNHLPAEGVPAMAACAITASKLRTPGAAGAFDG